MPSKLDDENVESLAKPESAKDQVSKRQRSLLDF
jgi:hypothetical protein